MKKSIALKLLLFFLVAGIMPACNLFDDDDPDIVDEYLVSYKLERSYEKYLINEFINNFVDAYPELEPLSTKVENGVMVYTLNYNTTFEGQPVVASGLVCIPVGEGPFPVMSYQNGTNTLHSEAPSVNPDRDLYRLLQLAASTGFIISMPDYIGFGETSDLTHPYLHAESTVQSVIDMLRAVEELTTNYLETNTSDELYIAGYSQGGWATMHLQKTIEQNYSSEFNLKASACGAGPYDLTYINNYILGQTTYPMPYFLGYMFHSYDEMGLTNVTAAEVFQAPYAARIGTIYDGTMTGEELNAELTSTVADLFTEDYITNYSTGANFQSLRDVLQENSVDAWNTSIPTMLIHGTDDEFVPFQVSLDMRQDFIDAGVSQQNITLVPIEGANHTEAIVPSGLLSVQWFLEMEE